MKTKKISKLIVTIIFLIAFSGCSSLMTYVGEKRIESGIQLYNSNGVTSYGIRKLASGLKYIPDSVAGVECFNKQSIEITKEKNNILKKKYYSWKDIERLKVYIILNEEASKISYKVKNLKFDYNIYINSRQKINRIFENYIIKDNRNSKDLSRDRKIERINYYKELNTYINSSRVYKIISSLEIQVTKKVYLTSSFMTYNYINTMVNDALFDFSVKNKGKEIKKYIYFDSYSKILHKNDSQYAIAMDFSECKAYSKGLITEKKVDREIITEHKELIIKGNYRLLTDRGGNFSKSKYFEVRKNYDVITEKYENRMTYGNEREKIMEILNDEFNKIIIRDLKNFL